MEGVIEAESEIQCGFVYFVYNEKTDGSLVSREISRSEFYWSSKAVKGKLNGNVSCRTTGDLEIFASSFLYSLDKNELNGRLAEWYTPNSS